MAFGTDATVVARVMGKKEKPIFYINEIKIKKVISAMETNKLNYVVAKENIKDELSLITRIGSLNSYEHWANVKVG